MKKFTLVLVGMLIAGKADAQVVTEPTISKAKMDSIIRIVDQRNKTAYEQMVRRATLSNRTLEEQRVVEANRELNKLVIKMLVGTAVSLFVVSRINIRGQRNGGYDGPCPDYWSRARDGSLCGYRAAPYR